MTDKEQVVIYTDGACKGNPGRGGWGALLLYKGAERELWGGEPDTTNNRMELMAAIQALAALKRSCPIRLITDSEYVMRGITEWLPNWKKRGWKTASKQPVRWSGSGSAGIPAIPATSGPTSWPTVASPNCRAERPHRNKRSAAAAAAKQRKAL